MPRKKKTSVEETPLLPAYFPYEPKAANEKKPKALKSVMKKLEKKSEKKEKKPVKKKVVKTDESSKVEEVKAVEKEVTKPKETKVESTNPIIGPEPIAETPIKSESTEAPKETTPVETSVTANLTSSTTPTGENIVSKIASAATTPTDPTPEPTEHVFQEQPVANSADNTMSHADYGAPFINNTVIGGGTEQPNSDSSVTPSTIIVQDDVLPAGGWKKHFRTAVVIFLILFMIFDLIVAYVLYQRRKIVTPVAGATYSVVPTGVAAQVNKKEVIAFLPSWMMSKNVPVNTHNLTQLIYFGLPAGENGDLIKRDDQGNYTVEWDYLNSEQFKKIQEESKYSKTKILLAVTSFDNENIDRLVSNPTATERLIVDVLKVMNEYNLDGININFEYVTDSDFPTAIHLNKFLEQVTTEIKKERPGAVISFDVNALAVEVDGAYDMVKIGELVDQVILMGYDYHRAPSTVAGPVAPIDGENEHSVTKSLQSMVGRVPDEKIILGLPFYGYEWQTISKQHRSATVANTGAVASYGRVKELLQNRPDIKVEWDEDSESPWFYYDQSGAIKQIYYEDEKSLQKKLDLVVARHMQGIAIWALGYEGSTNDLWDVINNWRK